MFTFNATAAVYIAAYSRQPSMPCPSHRHAAATPLKLAPFATHSPCRTFLRRLDPVVEDQPVGPGCASDGRHKPLDGGQLVVLQDLERRNRRNQYPDVWVVQVLLDLAVVPVPVRPQPYLRLVDLKTGRLVMATLAYINQCTSGRFDSLVPWQPRTV